LVKSYIDRFSETKYRGKDVVTSTFNSTIASAAEIYGIMPSIPKNATDSISAFGRLGDKIKPKSLKVHGHVALGVTGAYKRIVARVFVLTAKNIKNAAQKSTIDIVHMINDGQTDGGVGFNGTVQRRNFPVNKNLFNVLSDRSYELCQATQTSTTVAASGATGPVEGGATPLDGFISSDCNAKSWATFSLDIPCPATLMYNSAQGDDPTNWYPFVVIGYTNLDNAAGSTSGTEVYVSISSMISFDDA